MPLINVQQQARNAPATSKELPANSFYREVKPILLVMRAFGRFPYGMTEEGIVPFSFWSIPTIYCLAGYCGILHFSSQTVKKLILQFYLDSATYYEKLMSLILMAFLSQNFITPITYWLTAPRLVKYIEDWSRYESQFKKEFKKLQLFRHVKYVSIISIPTALVHVSCVVGMIFGFNINLIMGFYPVVVSSYMSMTLWFTCLHELRVQAKGLRRIISKDERPTDLDERRRCWAALSDLTSETGHCQGAACGFLTLTAFVSYLISIYGFFSSLFVFDEDSKAEWHLLWPLIAHTLFFYFMFERGERTSKEVGTNFIEMILKLRDKQLCFSDNNDELSLFLLTMYVGQPKVTFTGFTVVNRGLITSLISNTLTFLLVLIQFKS